MKLQFFAAVLSVAVFAVQAKDVVITIPPAYDWARAVVGSHTNEIQLTLLQQSGADLHSYRPSAKDVAKVAGCDLFIHVGGESDEWVEPLLKQSPKPTRQVLNFLSALGSAVRTEEVVEGMQGEEEEKDEKGKKGDKKDEEEEEEKDEHVWLSLRLAGRLVNEIAVRLEALDPAHAADYKANAAAYVAKLTALDARYVDMTRNAKRKTLLVADRFPFRYLVEDYGLKYYAAFVGCSAETEASFKTVVFLAKKVDEQNLPCVLTLEGSGHKIAETVVRATRAKSARIVTLDSLQTVGGDDYLTAMTRNLAALADALN